MPNQPLAEALGHLVKSGTYEPRSFSLYGSDEQVVGMEAFITPDFNQQEFEANRVLQEYSGSFYHIDGKIESRLLESKKRGTIALQLVMGPKERERYSHLRDRVLEQVQVGQRGFAPGFHATKIYATIPVEQLKPLGDVRRGLQEINTTLTDPATTHLYQLRPRPNLAGHTATRMRNDPIPPKQVNKRAS
jgi:hypothetical protein